MERRQCIHGLEDETPSAAPSVPTWGRVLSTWAPPHSECVTQNMSLSCLRTNGKGASQSNRAVPGTLGNIVSHYYLYVRLHAIFEHMVLILT